MDQHPVQLERLVAEPSGWPIAVGELLRFVSPTTLTGATTLQDVEAAGCAVRAGSRVALAFSAANRDSAVFENPDELDLTRAPNPHLAFSAGPHFCLGAPLARMHAEIALPALFTRLVGLHVVNGPVWLGSVPIRQIDSLEVAWTNRAMP